VSLVLYVEPEEEITDLVERIRHSGDEKELVFVLPSRARVLQSPLNLRLLQQYSRSFVKDSAIVSLDPRVQGLARQLGFATYASVQAYEQGVQVSRAPTAAELSAADADDVELRGAVATVPPRAPGHVGGRPPRPPLPARQPNRRRLYIIGAALFVVGVLLIFLVAPTATVTITLNPQPVKISRLIQGTTDTTAASGPDHVLTQVVSADESSQFQAKPTGIKQIPAAAASGSIVMTTDLRPEGACLQNIRKGQTTFTTQGSTAVVFLAAADVTSNSQNPNCPGLYIPPPTGSSDYGPPSDPVPVAAQSPGSAGNVAAQAINQWPSNPCNQSPFCSPKDLQVSNPQATSGGVDAHNITVASQQDVQQFQSQVDTLNKQLTDKVKQDMQAKSAGYSFAIDPTGQGQTLTTEVQPPLPNAGDQYSPTTIQVSAHGKAAMYKPQDVKKVINDDVVGQIPKDRQLATTPPPDTHDITITQSGDDGTVIFNATETAFTQPMFDFNNLKDRFAGKSKRSVCDIVEQVFASQVEPISQNCTVQQSIPFFVLPFFSSRIEVNVLVGHPRS